MAKNLVYLCRARSLPLPGAFVFGKAIRGEGHCERCRGGSRFGNRACRRRAAVARRDRHDLTSFDSPRPVIARRPQGAEAISIGIHLRREIASSRFALLAMTWTRP